MTTPWTATLVARLPAQHELGPANRPGVLAAITGQDLSIPYGGSAHLALEQHAALAVWSLR